MELFAVVHGNKVAGLYITCPDCLGEGSGVTLHRCLSGQEISSSGSYSTVINYTCPRHGDFGRAWDVHVCVWGAFLRHCVPYSGHLTSVLEMKPVFG